MKTMTVGELKALLAAEPSENDGCPIKVWLPGSTISLGSGGHGPHCLLKRKAEGTSGFSLVLIEGNVDPGSALDDLAGARARAWP